MKLKKYQDNALSILRKYLQEARISGPKAAFEAITKEPEQARRLRGYIRPYRPVRGLPELPYVCLRLPTGGGKTILAAHSVSVAKDAWVEKDFPLVLWLVPTNTIRQQTAEALKNPRHPYRQVLDEAFQGRVRVLDIGDFTQLTSHDLRSNACIVVGTIQTLRVANTEGRKVYAHHEMLEGHFSAVPNSTSGLQRYTAEDEARDKAAEKTTRPKIGDILFSFANLLHLHRPLIIMDEAHKAGTELSQDVYQRINPSALIEFTATPKPFNNVLHSVTAQELKDEQMIKMPVVLDEAVTWQGAVNSAILKRAELQAHADKDRDAYIRPIVLFQAQRKGEEVTVEVLKKHLIEVEDIKEDKIAVATGSQRELDGINLFRPDCKIEYVITIEALKEGWDCSFAYVFCSVANIRSATDAEQLLGRVLRMPYATRRKEAALNKSYAKLVSKTFSEAAVGLKDKLVQMGFEESEAEANIEAEQPGLDDGLFGRQTRPRPTLSVQIEMTPAVAKDIARAVPGKISVTSEEGGKATVKVMGFLKRREKEALYAQLPDHLHGEFQSQIAAFEAQHAESLSPAQSGATFTVPRLMAEVQGELVFGDTDILMEYHDWSLSDHPARLTPEEFSIVETTNSFEIDLNGDRVTIAAVDSSAQLTLDVDVDGWTEGGLVQFLDGRIRDRWIGQAELLVWLSDVVTYLTRDRGLPLAQLMRCKFILARKLADKIKALRQTERTKVYQLSLFGPASRVEVSFDKGFEFFDDMYFDKPKYRGAFRFNRHFMGPDEVPEFDAATDDGEEIKCALALDALPGLKYWTRNVSRHPNSFYLPTSTDRFYPDFVAVMQDGRLLVVEYKGSDRTPEESRDSREKDTIGKQWAKSSDGKAVFVMATMEKADPTEIRSQITGALGQR